MSGNKKKEYQEIIKNLFALHDWLQNKDFKYYTLNYTPSIKFIDSLSKRFNIIGILWRQLFRLSPINFRKQLGLSPDIIDPQATILLATAYFELLKNYSDETFKKSFEKCMERVILLRSEKSKYFAIRQGKNLYLKYYKTTHDDIAPLLTIWAGELFIKAYEYFNDEKYLQLAIEVKDYFVTEHPREESENGVYFYYSPSGNFKIWNASCEISSFLLKAGKILSDSISYKLGEKGMNLIIEKQNRDGSWFYGGTKATRYIDNFHTGFMLRAINQAITIYKSQKLEKALKLGMKFYYNSLFEKKTDTQICPKHFLAKYIPLNSNIIQKTDIRDCALSIILFSEMSDNNNDYRNIALYILNWTNKYMTRRQTYFVEKAWLWTNKIPYIDFQAWMLLAHTKYLTSIISNE